MARRKTYSNNQLLIAGLALVVLIVGFLVWRAFTPSSQGPEEPSVAYARMPLEGLEMPVRTVDPEDIYAAYSAMTRAIEVAKQEGGDWKPLAEKNLRETIDPTLYPAVMQRFSAFPEIAADPRVEALRTTALRSAETGWQIFFLLAVMPMEYGKPLDKELFIEMLQNAVNANQPEGA